MESGTKPRTRSHQWSPVVRPDGHSEAAVSGTRYLGSVLEETKGGEQMITAEVQEMLLKVAVRMAEVKTPGRDESTLGEIAQRLGELGELDFMRSLNAHRERMITCLRMSD